MGMLAHPIIRVVKAVEIDTPGLRIHAAPAGFPFLLHESKDGVKIVDPPTLFLFAKFFPVRRDPEKIGTHYRLVQNSAEAVANDLKDWWEFLANIGRSWKQADQEDFECYRDAMLSTISPHTGRKYRPTTVKRRMISILQFYQWANKAGLCRGQMSRLANLSHRNRVLRYREVGTFGNISERNEVLPRTSYSQWEHVRVLSIATYQKLANQVGPLPTAASSDDVDCQIRLGVELAINLGLRISEIVGLTVQQIASLGPPDANPLALRYITIDKTKGSKPRRAAFPSWLVAELIHYIANQRCSGLRLQKAYNDGSEAGALLLHDSLARHHCGTPLTAQTLRRKFGEAQIKCGLTRNIAKLDLGTGKQSEVQTTVYRFHDLRHTFAVWLYYAEKLSGNPEPWKTIQSRLGHEYLSTTQNIYLRATSDFEAEVSDVASADLLAGARSVSWAIG